MSTDLHAISGGMAKREREAWQRSCSLRFCDGAPLGMIDTIFGPMPVCAEHTPRAEALGYIVRRRPATDD